jgi:ATP-dependent protease HslVU (ClpYQ) peptidase subunit
VTAIAGISDGTRVFVGGDSCSSDGNSATRDLEPKVFRIGRMIVGVCGTARLCQKVAYVFRPPARRGLELRQYLAGPFAKALNKALGDNDDGYEMNLMLGIDGRLFVIDSALGFTEPADGYWAIGSGGEAARCVLDDLHKHEPGLAPRKRILRALDAAAKHCVGVAPPFVVLPKE